MPVLHGKNILLISPQAWDKVKVSKHHYAISLAMMGNRVYFLNPPSDNDANDFKLLHSEYENLTIVQYSSFFPLWIRFKFRLLFDFLMGFQIKSLMKKIDLKFDIIWCFEPNLYLDLKKFGGAYFIFHPVDVFHQKSALHVAGTADIIFSVSPSILDQFKNIPVPKHFINHGLGSEFAINSQRLLEQIEEIKEKTIKKTIGYIGNLLIKYIDREIFISIIKGLPDMNFMLIGPYELSQSVLGGSDSGAIQFINSLQSLPNVELTGPKSASELIPLMNRCDAFLICYTDKIQGYDLSNTHKMLEYLSTGKPVFSTPIQAYLTNTDIISMPVGLNSTEYSNYFIGRLKQIDALSVPTLMKKRMTLAIDNTYRMQLSRIEALIEQKYTLQAGYWKNKHFREVL